MDRDRTSVVSSAVFAVTLVVGALLTNLTGHTTTNANAATSLTASAAAVATEATTNT